jgi:CelD/BcsL family acetyltransferase involved in cellulose biosynthesis
MNDSLHIKVLTTWPEIEAFRAELTVIQKAEHFFSELAVQKSWWESTGQPALKVIAVSSENQAVGLFLFCQKDTTLQLFGGRDVTDYLDVIIVDGKEDQAWDGLKSYLKSDDSWRRISLLSIPEHSQTHQQLQRIATELGTKFIQSQQDVCPIIPLPASWDEYLQFLGKKQRHEVTRKWKRLAEQAQISFRVVTDTTSNPEALETFFELHRLSSPEKAAFWTPEHQQFFRKLSQSSSQGGWLRLYFIDVNNEPAAAMYCFEYADSLLVYNSGFAAEKYIGMSVGNVLAAYTIQDAITLGKRTYDFLRGGEQYKLRYGATPHPVFDLELQKDPVV